MKIAIIGATGNVGSRLVDEALSRGHQVAALSRSAKVLSSDGHLNAVAVDANDPDALAGALNGHDAVISSVRFRVSDPDKLITAVRKSGVKRYLVVGGAGSLLTADGTLHVDSPHFPALYRDEALGGKRFLDKLRDVKDLNWTMLSPSALFVAGERTGAFRLGTDTLLTSGAGKSWISFEDFAIALIDELETPRHPRMRFTVGY